MEILIDFIIRHSNYAPFILFGMTLLAGCNFPISIDALIILSAFLAATTLPKLTFALFFSLLLGCYFSAWIAYWIGRKGGTKLLNTRWFSHILPPPRIKKIRLFYEKYGLLTLIIGRFIPFGMRNCIFMTTGISQVHFGKFICQDALACSIWTTTAFYVYYRLGLSYDILFEKLKILHFVLFFALSVTVIGFLWYKKHKQKNRL